MKMWCKKRKTMLGLCAALALSGCALLPVEQEHKMVLVDDQDTSDYIVEMVQYQDVVSSVVLYASYSQMGSKMFCFERSGVLGKVYVEPGDIVEKGQMLATLSDYDDVKADVDFYTSELVRLTAQKESLEYERTLALRRIEILQRYGQMTEAEYMQEMRTLTLEYDEALQELADTLEADTLRVEDMRRQLEERTIYSDRDGVVTQAVSYVASIQDMSWKMRDDSDLSMSSVEERMNRVTTDTVIVTVSDMDKSAFVCDTEYADKFSVGDYVTLQGGGTLTYDTVVTELQDGRIYLQPEIADLNLSVGTTARYTLVLEERKNVLAVSKNSVHETEDGYYVYYVDENGLRQMKEVSVGITGNVSIEITEGLEPGDLVIKQ